MELDSLLTGLLQLERLRPTELDPNVSQNGSRTWSLSPELIELGQQWIRDEQAGLQFDNRSLHPEDFEELTGTFHMMEDINGTRPQLKYQTISFRQNKREGPSVKGPLSVQVERERMRGQRSRRPFTAS